MYPSKSCLLLFTILQFALLHITYAAPVSKLNDTSTYDEIENINKKANRTFFEGDILPSPLVDEVVNGAFNGEKREARRDRQYLWRTRVIPYVITSDFPTVYEKDAIRNAMDIFEQNTCLRFKQHSNEANWINFVKKDGCYSVVGRNFWTTGAQEISLGSGCLGQSTILHEIMHAIGFWHEQSRPDRNDFIEIFWENIIDDQSHNFAKYSHLQADVLGTQYDYDTLMHYGKKAFSKNGKQTLKAIGSDRELGQSNSLGASDIVAINALYGCASKDKSIWSTWSSYGPCDSRCFKTRERFCSHLDLKECPTANSYGVAEEQVTCSDAECNAPVDGHWGRWSSWSACNAECGPGKRNRSRVCDNPLPKNGGKVCAGESKSFTDCYVKRCGMGPFDCEFEGQGWCSWKNDATNTPRFYWGRVTGRTPTSKTGPTSDHTTGTGHYIYTEASAPAKANDKARIISKEMPATEGLCMSFWYHMHGLTMGTLKVLTNSTNGVKSAIWSKSGDQGSKWLKGNINITSQTPFKVIFESIRGQNYRSDIALDDIFFKDCPPKSSLEQACGVKMEALGCFNQNYNDPLLPILLDNHRDPNHGHVGFTINWRNYPQSMQDILCHCAQKSKERGYKYFGLSFYAECWAGPGEINYNKHGVSDRCVNAKYEKCPFSKYGMCSGAAGNYFIYKL